MITSRRDYMMRILEEVSRLLARVSFKRRKGDTDNAALETVVFGFQRLFNLDSDQIFLLTPSQHYDLLADAELIGNWIADGSSNYSGLGDGVCRPINALASESAVQVLFRLAAHVT